MCGRFVAVLLHDCVFQIAWHLDILVSTREIATHISYTVFLFSSSFPLGLNTQSKLIFDKSITINTYLGRQLLLYTIIQ